jgi:hypothetical protein
MCIDIEDCSSGKSAEAEGKAKQIATRGQGTGACS